MKIPMKSILATPSVSLFIMVCGIIISYISAFFTYSGTDFFGRSIFFIMSICLSIIPLIGSIKQIRINFRVLTNKKELWKTPEFIQIIGSLLYLAVMNHNVFLDCAMSLIMGFIVIYNIQAIYYTDIEQKLSKNKINLILNSKHKFWMFNKSDNDYTVHPIDNDKIIITKDKVIINNIEYDDEKIKNMELLMDKSMYDMSLDDIKVVEMFNY